MPASVASEMSYLGTSFVLSRTNMFKNEHFGVDFEELLRILINQKVYLQSG